LKEKNNFFKSSTHTPQRIQCLAEFGLIILQMEHSYVVGFVVVIAIEDDGLAVSISFVMIFD